MKKSHILTLILFTVIIACCYVHVFYSHKLSTFNWLDQIFIASSIYFLILIWFPWNKLINALAFILIAGLSLVCVNILQSDYADAQLKAYGVTANAIVKSVKYKSGSKTAPGIIIMFTYSSGGRLYKHRIVDDIEIERRFVVGDTLPIIYSSKDPDLFKETAKGFNIH